MKVSQVIATLALLTVMAFTEDCTILASAIFAARS